VHVEDRVEFVGVHVLERRVPQDPGVVDDDVDPAPVVERGLHDRPAALGAGDRVVVCDRLAPRRRDLVDHRLRGGRAAAGAVDRAAEVVDDDQGTAAGQLQRMGTAQAPAGARDDRDLAIEPEISHGRRA
jgi:hypothetical protein